jgi:hypothetical protein
MSTVTPLDAETLHVVRDLLTTAFEGGSNHWYSDLEVLDYPDGLSKDYFEHSVHTDLFWHIDVPIRAGGRLQLVDDEGDKHVLDLPALTKGFAAFSKEVPHQLRNALADGGDAETGDCFLQCCIFGDVVYG